MINQQFRVLGRKYQLLPDLGICCRDLGGLTVFAHLCTVSSLSLWVGYGPSCLSRVL